MIYVKYMIWRRKWQSTLVFLPGESHGQKSLAGYSLWGCKESDTTEELHYYYYSGYLLEPLVSQGGIFVASCVCINWDTELISHGAIDFWFCPGLSNKEWDASLWAYSIAASASSGHPVAWAFVSAPDLALLIRRFEHTKTILVLGEVNGFSENRKDLLIFWKRDSKIPPFFFSTVLSLLNK